MSSGSPSSGGTGGTGVIRELDIEVLVPAQVWREVARLHSQVDRWATDLVARAGGRCLDETTPRRPADDVAQPVDDGRFAAA